MTRRRRSVAAVAAGLGGLMLSLGITGPANADDPDPPIPPKTCPQEVAGLTQIAWPEGATPPMLPYGEFHKMTDEHADRGLVFTENDSDMSSAYKRYNPVSGTYNTVHMGTFGNLYRANFLNSDVRRVTFKLDDTNVSATIHRLSAFSASGSRLAQVEYRDWQAKPGPYNSHEDHSFTMTVNSTSTPIKSVVYTQLTSNGQRHAFSASTWCVQYGTPAPPPPPPPPPPAPACPSKTVTANADAWFEQGSTSNKGDDSSLAVQSKQGQASRSVVRFPLTALPAGCVLDRAELRLYAESAQSGRTIDVQPLAGPWQEMAVNWSTQPATTGAVASTGSGSDKGWRTWQVTEQVAGMLASGTSNGFVIRDRDESQDATQKYNSRESSSNRPALVLTLREGTPTTPPPPTNPPPPPVP